LRKSNLHPAILLFVLAVLLTLIFFAVHRHRYRFVRQPVDLVGFLPLPLPLQQGELSTFYVDVAALRRGGYLELLASPNATREPDYHQFVESTNFDYTRDIDALAGAASADRINLFVQGRFDWSRLRNYARTHSGSCESDECTVPASKAGRWIGFTELQPDVMAFTVSGDKGAAAAVAMTAMAESRPASPRTVSADPVWFCPSRSLLDKPNTLPPVLRMLAIAVQSADAVTVSLAPSNQAAFAIKLKASFAHPAMADTSKNQLEIDTKMLKLALARENTTPSPSDLTGLFAGGTFIRQGRTLLSTWPVQKEFVQALQ
jgi:hypothetical protein